MSELGTDTGYSYAGGGVRRRGIGVQRARDEHGRRQRMQPTEALVPPSTVCPARAT